MDITFILEKMRSFNEEIALVNNEKNYNYIEIIEEYLKCKNFLAGSCSIPNPIVALVADYSPSSIAMMLALMEINATIVPLSKTIIDIDKYLQIAECEYLLDMRTNDYYFIKKTKNTVTKPILLQLKKEDTSGIIFFSSGTTGEPKAAVHKLLPLLEKFKKEGKKLSSMTFLLFDHIGGFNTLMYSLCNGSKLVLLKNRDPQEICRLIEQHKIELLPTSPTFINLLLLNKSYNDYDLSSLKVISYGTEPMPESTLKALHTLFPHLQLKQTYGLSELGIMTTKSLASDSLFIQLKEDEHLQYKIKDDILFVKTSSPMLGYLNASSPFDEDGFFNTQDKVIVEENYLKILGRISDIVIIGGEKVYPIEVESVFLSFPKILDISIYGIENPIMGKVLEAKVKVHQENNNREFIKELRVFAKNKLESYKIPAKFILTEDNLHSARYKKQR